LSLESCNGKDDAVDPAEVNIEKRVKASTSLLPGVREHGMLDIRNRRQPGRTYPVSTGTEYVGQVITKRERQKPVGSRMTA
jgi:hypothetical protein